MLFGDSALGLDSQIRLIVTDPDQALSDLE